MLKAIYWELQDNLIIVHKVFEIKKLFINL